MRYRFCHYSAPCNKVKIALIIRPAVEFTELPFSIQQVFLLDDFEEFIIESLKIRVNNFIRGGGRQNNLLPQIALREKSCA
jgi:hypothetical protein